MSHDPRNEYALDPEEAMALAALASMPTEERRAKMLRIILLSRGNPGVQAGEEARSLDNVYDVG